MLAWRQLKVKDYRVTVVKLDEFCDLLHLAGADHRARVRVGHALNNALRARYPRRRRKLYEFVERLRGGPCVIGHINADEEGAFGGFGEQTTH